MEYCLSGDKTLTTNLQFDITAQEGGLSMYSAKAIANYFLEKGWKKGIELSPLKLMKLVYLAHGWYLGSTQKPLIRDYVHAWTYGPVIPELYHEFKKYGNQPIGECAREVEDSDGDFRVHEPLVKDKLTKQFLDIIWGGYKDYSASQLSAMTHQSGAPWDTTKKSSDSNKSKRDPVIDDDVIQEYYVKRIRESSEG